MGQRLVVVRAEDGTLVDAAVASYDPDPQHPARHTLALSDGSVLLPFDLNPFNHCQLCLSSDKVYRNVAATYCEGLAITTEYVEDGITGTKLRTQDQLLAIDVRLDAGVTREGFSDVSNIAALCKALLAPSPQRARGTHHTQPVLLRSGAGAGKTWASIQLTHKMAIMCMHITATSAATPLIPVCYHHPSLLPPSVSSL